VRGGLAVRLGSLVVGLFLFALAIVLILESKLGLSPWDVLNQGLSKHTPLSFGMANVAVAIARRRIKTSGDVKAALALIPITKPVYAQYRAVVEADYPHLKV